MKITLIVLIGILSLNISANGKTHGDIRKDIDQTLQIWNQQSHNWQDIELFWTHYAQNSNGFYWGKRQTYPVYSDVNEHDTLMIELSQGVCLMEFFHKRWRRANDVKRWNVELNEFGGCPYVFD